MTISLTVLFLFLSAFFSGSETAIFSMPRERFQFYRASSNRFHRWIYALYVDGQRTLLLILLGNLVVNLYLVKFIDSLLAQYIPESTFLATMIMATSIILIFGEMLPKNIALKNNETIALLIAPGLFYLKRLLSPLLWLFKVLISNVLSRFRRMLRDPSPYVTIDELKTGLEKASRDGIFDTRERRLIHAILDMGETPVRQILRHRSQIPILHSGKTVQDARRELRNSDASSVLVCRQDDRDIIQGLIAAAQLIGLNPAVPLGRIARPPLWVPESMALADLVRFCCSGNKRVVCVLDEHGSFVGTVSLAAGLSKILESAPLGAGKAMKPQRHRLECNGTEEIETLTEWLPQQFQSLAEKYRTINGVITHHLGYIPRTGESFALGEWKFYIIDSIPNRIMRIAIQRRFNTV